MGFLKVYVVLLSFVVSVLGCELPSPQAVVQQRKELADFINNKKAEINGTYRLLYHVMPPVGWMNDPNGFAFFKGQYHLFYQFYPYNSSWGPMHWGHSTSSDLVNWTEKPTALIPGDEQIFSGSAIEIDGTMVLMYTGHKENPKSEAQYLAFSNDGVTFNKYKFNPVISGAPNGSPDFRDPKVWKHDQYYYVIMGSTDPVDSVNPNWNQTIGKSLLYRSDDMKTWHYLNEIGIPSSRMGYMWECPDFFELGGKYILLMSPQGMKAEGDRFQNLYQTGYIIGTFSYVTNKFVQEVEFQEIDYGHDFYATQTTERLGKRYLIAWFGMWKTTFPEAEHKWAGAMTIFRELTLKGNRILMNPVKDMEQLRETPVVHNKSLPENGTVEFGNKAGELVIKGDWSQNIELEIVGSSGGGIILRWDTQNVTADRNGDIRRGPWTPANDAQTWRIFLDASSMELFCGEGDVVFSSRVYPTGNWVVRNTGPQPLDVIAYKLKGSLTPL